MFELAAPAVVSLTDAAERTDERSADHRECEICGERVPVPIYREHLLKECPGP